MPPSKFGEDYPVWSKIWNTKLIKKHRAGAQLEAILLTLIENGEFKYEERLPPVYLLARKMETTSSTVRKTYIRLRKKKLVITKRGIGTYVAKKPPLGYVKDFAIPAESKLEGLIFNESSPKMPKSDLLRLGRDIPGFSRLSISKYLNFISRVISDVDSGSSNAPALRDEIREVVKKVLQKRGIIANNNQFTVIPQNAALQLVISTLVKPGDHIVIESPSDQVPYKLFVEQRAEVHFSGTVSTGIKLSKLEAICKSVSVRFVFVRPAASFPELQEMNESKREKLVSLSLKYKFFIISTDEHYGWWHKQPRAPLLLRRHGGNVIYISSVSNLLPMTSDLNVVVAHQIIIQSILEKTYQLNIHSGLHMEIAVARLIEEGWISTDTAKLLHYYQGFQKKLKQLFQKTISPFAQLTLPHAGLNIYIKFNKPTSLKGKIDQLIALDVLDPLCNRQVDLNRPISGIRLGYANKPFSVWEQVFKLLHLAISESSSKRKKK